MTVRSGARIDPSEGISIELIAVNLRISTLKLLMASCLLLPGTRLFAADIAANATRDAMRLAACMKALDAACANALTYTKSFEEHGITRDKIDDAVTTFYQQLKSVHGVFSSLELSAPWRPFNAGEQTYIFIPYSAVLNTSNQTVVTTSFFIGVSEDAGLSWKFVDGLRRTPDNIGMIIPGYDGLLPPQAVHEVPPE